MERVKIDKIVDMCWFCKAWFFVEKLSEIEVLEESFGSKTVSKAICDDCSEQIKTRSHATKKQRLDSQIGG